MKICGIICEYNPLHNGHIRHLTFTKSNCDAVICIMSGNYVQRGETACLEKHLRAVHAVKAGADIVVELPTVFSVAPADDFAYGAMKYLTALECAAVSFGSECGDISELIDGVIQSEYNAEKSIKAALKSGASYPKAYSIAANSTLLDTPNNLLAMKYISSGTRLGYKGGYLTVKREGSYNSLKLEASPSSTAIRIRVNSDLKKGGLRSDELLPYLSDYVVNDIGTDFFAKEIFEDFVRAYITLLDKQYIKSLYGVNEGLENRIFSSKTANSYDDLITGIKSKRYTMLRIKRILTCAVLGITRERVEKAKSMTPYVNILAIKEDRKDLLRHISRCNVTKDTSKYDSIQNEIREIDIKGDKLFNALIKKTYPNQYLTKVTDNTK